MTERTASVHGRFMLRWLEQGMTILDVGCGPGAIALGLARAVAPGTVIGVDVSTAEVRRATAAAARRKVGNARFVVGSCYRLPLPGRAVDAVFAHALLEHVISPVAVLAEAYRVLRPGGTVGVCSPWGILTPQADEQVESAVGAYVAAISSAGGDLRVGPRLGALLRAAGFARIRMDMRIEWLPSPQPCVDLLSAALDSEGQHEHAAVLRTWAVSPQALMGIPWVSAVARRP